MDKVYLGESDSVHLCYQSGRDDVHIKALGMIYLIYITIGKRVLEQPFNKSIYRCLGK